MDVASMGGRGGDLNTKSHDGALATDIRRSEPPTTSHFTLHSFFFLLFFFAVHSIFNDV